MKIWTKTRLKRRCYALAKHPNTTIHCAVWNKRHQMETVTWDERSIQIRVDVHQAGLIPSVIHGLIHVAMQIPVRHSKVDTGLEEGSVVSWTAEIWQDVAFSPTQMRRWRKIINEHLYPRNED